MPVSHIGLTVSHLPTSCSFFLAALQPLGYRFLGQWGNQIGLGVNEADFFLTQETPGIKAGAAHVAFSASNRIAVREFYANALQAGGRPHGSPGSRLDGDECFNAAVLDLDGNSVEVVFHESAGAAADAASDAGKSRLLTWRKGVSANLSDNRSTVDSIASAATSLAKKALVPTSSTAARSNRAPSEAPSAAPTNASRTTAKPRSEAPAIQRSFTMPALTPQSSNDNISISRKTLVGTILGAAAGAAVAYAMCKSEEDSAKAEQAAYLAAQDATKHLQASRPRLLDAKPQFSSPARSVQNASEIEYVQGYHPVRAIEAPPTYQHPSFTTVVSGHPVPESVASKSRVSAARSQSYPESRARSSIISSFVPEEQTRAIPDFEYGSSPVHTKSHHSKTKSSTSSSKHSSASKHSSRSRDQSRSRSKSRTPQPSLSRILESDGDAPAKASSRTSKASTRTSVLGRSVMPDHYPSSSDRENSNDDLDTIVPSDSVSQIGSSSSRRPHRRQSEPSSSSHHSTSSSRRDDSRRASEVDMMAVEPKKKHKKKKSHRTSEAGTESTMTPDKYVVHHSAGSAMSLPVRGITPSMIGSGVQGRSVVSYYG
jgi:catechol 2,3-dioxygenase-like lactoylglutathione lyase family enzyme